MSNPKNDLLVKGLIEAGFSDKEARIYIALLEAETATANELAKATGINRSSTYVVLEGLKNKGFVGLSNDKKVQGYVPVSPDIILETLENNIKEQNILKDKIRGIIPNLKRLDKGSKKAPVVRVLGGMAGFREAYMDVYSTNVNEFRVYEKSGNIQKTFPGMLKQHRQIRAARGVKLYSIGPAIKKTMGDWLSGPNDPLLLNVFIPENKFGSSIGVTLYNNKVSFISPEDQRIVIIEHEQIAESLKNIFDLAFEEAKRIRVNKNLTNVKDEKQPKP